MFDFDQFGDSPTCLGKDENVEGMDAYLQGFGLTEEGRLADVLLESKGMCNCDLKKL